jgi:hypothetical protein
MPHPKGAAVILHDEASLDCLDGSFTEGRMSIGKMSYEPYKSMK